MPYHAHSCTGGHRNSCATFQPDIFAKYAISARENSNCHQTGCENAENYFDAHVKGSTFTEGQLVWLYHPKPLLRQRYRKLNRLWIGPYRINRFCSDVVVELQHTFTKKKTIAHINRIIPCKTVIPTESVATPATPPAETVERETPSQTPSHTRRPVRKRKPPPRLDDYEMNESAMI